VKTKKKHILMGEYLDTVGLEIEFGMAKSTQAKYRKQLDMPYKKIGGAIYYKISEIKAWIDKHSCGMAV